MGGRVGGTYQVLALLSTVLQRNPFYPKQFLSVGDWTARVIAIHSCVHVCMYGVYMYVYVYVCVCVCLYYVCICSSVHVCIYVMYVVHPRT